MTKDGVLHLLVEAIREVSPITEEALPEKPSALMENTTYLVDLGVSSIDYVEIIAIITNKLDINLSVDAFESTNNINEIVSILYGEVCQKEKATGTG